tara:strand:+ start:72 stop:464 length:393 start_codon:yes stop_codon:yes gene_type:complete
MVFSEEEKKERRKEARRKYNEKNRERNRERELTRYYKNKEEMNEKQKAYYKTEQGRKSYKINSWKDNGVICENFDNLYDYYVNCKNCEQCDVELTVDRYNTRTTRCLDHCHKTGRFRNVLCNYCNIKRRW